MHYSLIFRSIFYVSGFTLLAILSTPIAFADNSATEQGLSIELIMQDPQWLGRQPQDAWWTWNGDAVYYTREQKGESISDTWLISVDDKPQKVTGQSMANISSPAGRIATAHEYKVFVRDGNIFIRNLISGELRQLTQTTQAESNPLFMANDKQVAWQIEHTWFIHNLASGLTRQVADIKTSPSPEKETQQENANFDYLKAQQLRLFSTLRKNKQNEIQQRKHSQAQQKADPTRLPLPFYLGDKVEIAATSLAPNGQYLLVITQPADYDNGNNDEMPVYVTGSGYVEHEKVRTLVGENPSVPQQILLLDLRKHEQYELALKSLPGITQDPLAKLRKKALAWHVEHGAPRDKVKEALKAPDVRAVQIESIKWTDDGEKVALQIHSVDNKDRWIASVDFNTQTLQTLHRLHDPAWINWYFNAYGWLPKSHTLWYLSEETGYSHLYLKPENENATALTQGEWEVSSPVSNASGSAIYFIANKQHPGWHDIYRVSTTSGDLTRLTTIGVDPAFRVNTYMAPFYLSPDEEKLLFRHSDITHPPELYIQANQADAVAQRLTHTISEKYLAQDWNTPEIIKIPSDDIDRPIYSKLYLPENYDPNKTYPAVMFVHGAGYLHNVHYGWASYFREFMFNTLLTQQGYIVFEMDYRGSAGYGRDWRTAIYRQMGHPELDDYLTGKQWLVDNYNVDPQKVGIYGGSYGGFMAFMALFRAPDAFAAGAALRPVTDWAHYNHPYTSNILNTPLVDPMAYEKSSPIEWAENYQNVPLLICHGMQDDNVFYKDTVRLVERLLELEKENYYPMYYPLDPHGFTHDYAWLDEYRRIFKLFERNLKPEH